MNVVVYEMMLENLEREQAEILDELERNNERKQALKQRLAEIRIATGELKQMMKGRI